MEKPLSMLLLTLGGFIAAAVLLATVFPAITRTGNAIASERSAIGEQSLQEIAVANALSELDGTGTWQDTDTDTYFDIWAWVNNIGSVTLLDIDDLDVFVHTTGTSARIPHTSDAANTYPQWSAAVEGGGEWVVDATLKITIHYSGTVTPGTFTIEAVTPEGARSLGNYTF
jgi:hypothetical protein